MPTIMISLWAQQQQNGIAEFIPIIIMLLLFVLPNVLKYFAEQAAKKKQREIEERQQQKRLQDVFSLSSAAEEVSPPPKPKKERRRKKTELVPSVDAERSTHGTRLSRELTPQGEGVRFDARPGTLDATQVLAPSVEPTVQPMLESMTGIYDAPSASEQSADAAPLARDIFQTLSTPNGLRQTVILSEIFKRPEY